MKHILLASDLAPGSARFPEGGAYPYDPLFRTGARPPKWNV